MSYHALGSEPPGSLFDKKEESGIEYCVYKDEYDGVLIDDLDDEYQLAIPVEEVEPKVLRFVEQTTGIKPPDGSVILGGPGGCIDTRKTKPQMLTKRWVDVKRREGFAVLVLRGSMCWSLVPFRNISLLKRFDTCSKKSPHPLLLFEPAEGWVSKDSDKDPSPVKERSISLGLAIGVGAGLLGLGYLIWGKR